MHSQLMLILHQVPGRTPIRHRLQALLVVRHDVRPPSFAVVPSSHPPLVLSLVAVPMTPLRSEIISPHMPPIQTNSSTTVVSLLQLSPESLASLVNLQFDQDGQRSLCNSCRENMLSTLLPPFSWPRLLFRVSMASSMECST